MDKQEMAIMYSGGTDSLALYALAFAGFHPEIQRPRRIHLLHMLNGMGRFPDWPRNRFETARGILANRVTSSAAIPESFMVELDMGRLFQGLWLDRYEEFMPKYGGKNLVCVACKLAMHARAIMYCMEHLVPCITTGYAQKQGYYPEQTPIFMSNIAELSGHFNIKTIFPVYEEFDDVMVTRHLLEEYGLPSTGGGERKCLFCQTLTTATEKEIGSYLDDMTPRIIDFIEHQNAGRLRDAANCFPPGT